MRMMIVRNELFYDAANRIRWCLIVLNIIQVAIGTVLVVIGSILCYHINRTSDTMVPQIWTIGLPHIVFGICGVASLIHAHKITVLVWLVFSAIILPLSFTLFTLTDCFETTPFRVHLQVYENCATQNQLCVCVWAHSEKEGILEPGSCEDIHWATSLYLCMISVFILGLVLMIIILGLGFTMTLCIKHCIPKEIKPLYSSCTTANGFDISAGYFRTRSESHKNGRSFLAVPVNDQENSTTSERTFLSVPVIDQENSTCSERVLLPS